MNNIEIEDVFHSDFTTATPGEEFIAHLEDILHKWNLRYSKIDRSLQPGDFTDSNFETDKHALNYKECKFTLFHMKLKYDDNEDNIDDSCEDYENESPQCQIDALDTSNDFAPYICTSDHMEIVRYYGLQEFLVLEKSITYPSDHIIEESQIKQLLSAVTIAFDNANCDIPIFIQIKEPWQKLYLGVSISKRSCVHFDMVHLAKIPPHCRHLTGLLGLFKQKLGEGCATRLDPIMVSIRFSYSVNDWTNSEWTQEPPDFDFMQGKTLGVAELGKLPFGVTLEPIAALHLFTTWPQVSECLVLDWGSYTALDPLQAPEWSVKVDVKDTKLLLEGYLKEFLNLSDDTRTMVELLGEGAMYINNDRVFSSAFNALTESRIPTISTAIGKVSTKMKNKNVEGPITDEMLLPILYFLFPDADDNTKTPYADGSGHTAEEDLWRDVKTCAVDSLVWRLSIVAAHCVNSLGQGIALAQLWHEFVQEIRFRWERNILIPGVAHGPPDTKTCLLHQKLQLMNCCIEKRKAREELARKSQSTDIDEIETEEEEEEVFFDCSSDEAQNEERSSARSQSVAGHLLWNKPVGRLSKHSTLKLLQTGDPLYLPVTQEPVPKTEDQLDEEQRAMLMFDLRNASDLVARMMNATLLSDMESFKAANPDSVLEDFIRWYSPRDWIEEQGSDDWGQPKGQLSQRMLIADNLWTETWTSALPVPAHRQKQLFDETREAEKVLHFFSTQSISEIVHLLIRNLFQAAICTLSSYEEEALPNVHEIVEKEHKMLKDMPPIYCEDRGTWTDFHTYDVVISEIAQIEKKVSQFKSLQHKLGTDGKEERTAFVSNLMSGEVVNVPDGSVGDIGARVATLFRDAQKAARMMSAIDDNTEIDAAGDGKHMTFPEPSRKEFILRTVTPRPSPISSPQVQRLYACLQRDDIRLAGFFSEDTIFF